MEESKHNPKKRLLNNEQIKDAYNIYKSSKDITMDQLAKSYNIKPRTMRKYLDLVRLNKLEEGSRVYNNKLNTEPYKKIVEECIERHKNGSSIRELSEEYHIPYSTLYRRLKS